MLPIHKIIWHEWREKNDPVRVPEPSEAMDDLEQIRSYVKAYEWGGPTSALQLHHLRELSKMIRPGDTVLDLACGPGPLLLELAPLYPECHFIGADLSRQMLSVLQEACAGRRITNVKTLCEDIRLLPSLSDRSIDMIISTSALHHLPELDGLGQVFQRIEALLKHDGGLYVFDFGLVRSERTRELLVADVAAKAPALTAVDYAHSLKAAFPIDSVVSLALRHIPRHLTVRSSRFVDFFYFVRTANRCRAPAAVVDFVSRTMKHCGLQTKIEAHLLSRLQKTRERPKQPTATLARRKAKGPPWADPY